MMRNLLVFTGFLLVWLIILMPLKLVALVAGSQMALSYSDVFESVWDGRVHHARFAGRSVERIDISADPLALFSGNLAVDVRVTDPDLRGRGRLTLGFGGRLRLENLSGVANLSAVQFGTWPGVSPDALVSLEIDSLVWKNGACLEAQGRASSGALSEFAATFGYDGPLVDGHLSCRAGDLVVAFDGETSDLGLTGDIVLQPTGYAWSLALETSQSDLADAFALAGLERDGDEWRGSGRGRYGD